MIRLEYTNMSLKNIEAEDLALLGAISLSILAVLVGEFYESPLFTALKILSTLLSLGVAVHRIATGKPFFKDMSEEDWPAGQNEFEVRIPRSEHRRGKAPQIKCFVPNGEDRWAECIVSGDVCADGEVIVQIGSPHRLRIEIRK